MIDVEPFRVDVPDAVLDDLHERLAQARLPNWIDGHRLGAGDRTGRRT